jgi:hypothetical protein
MPPRRRLARLLLAAGLLLLAEAAPLRAAEVVVRRGDTLARLASRHLGDADRWRELAALNGIERPEDLQEGMVLTLPAGAEPAPEARALPPRAESLLPIPDSAAAPARGPEPVAAGTAPGATGTGGVTPRRPDPIRFHLREWRARDWGALDTALALGGLALGLFLGWMAGAVAIRLGCWFALVEASWGAALKLGLLALILPVVLGGAHVLLFGGPVWAGLASRGGWSFALAGSVMAVVAAGALLAGVVATLRILRCRLRSVLTVWVMTEVGLAVLGAALYAVVGGVLILAGMALGAPVV